jgi:hypothetical protein
MEIEAPPELREAGYNKAYHRHQCYLTSPVVEYLKSFRRVVVMWMDCAWTISFDLGDTNELTSKVRRLLDQAQAVFRKYGMELDEKKKTELAVIYKANQRRKQWETDANRWSMR